MSHVCELAVLECGTTVDFPILSLLMKFQLDIISKEDFSVVTIYNCQSEAGGELIALFDVVDPNALLSGTPPLIESSGGCLLPSAGPALLTQIVPQV